MRRRAPDVGQALSVSYDYEQNLDTLLAAYIYFGLYGRSPYRTHSTQYYDRQY